MGRMDRRDENDTRNSRTIDTNRFTALFRQDTPNSILTDHTHCTKLAVPIECRETFQAVLQAALEGTDRALHIDGLPIRKVDFRDLGRRAGR